MSEEIRTIEIGGVKLDVDLRTATQVHSYKVGDPVKVLIKKYGDTFEVHKGVVLDFVPFEQLPTIVVAYLESDYQSTKFKVVHINNQSKDGPELAPITDLSELGLEKKSVLSNFQNEIDKKLKEVQDLEQHREFFLKRFGQYFEQESAALN